MTRKHFKALADALFNVRPQFMAKESDLYKQWRLDVDVVASACSQFNGQFDRGRFLDACGVNL